MGRWTRVGVVGCGVMGAGLAEACARAGCDVQVVASSPLTVDAGRRRVRASLDRAVGRGKLTEDERDAVLGRIRFGAELESMADRHLVIEAVTEREAVKLDVFSALDKIADPSAVLASNTSSLPIVRLARITRRPAQVVGMHFFNPVHAMPLVEVVGSLLTPERTLARVEDFATSVLGKQVVRSADRAGFIVNGLLVPYLLAAIRMVESGFATAEAVDRAMALGCAHPMGPLRLADLVGLDTLRSIALALHDEFREPAYAPPPLLNRMVEAGLLGRKSGRGFHPYE